MNFIRHKLFTLASVALLLFAWSSCSDEGYEDVTGTKSQTLWEVIQSRSDLSQFAAVLRAQGFDETLSSSGNYTVLAPVNDYVATLSADEVQALPTSQIALFSYNATALAARKYLTMMNDKQLILDNQNLSEEEIVCRNGYLRFVSPNASLYTPGMDNIYEKLQTLAADYEMAAFIISLGDSVMDVDASIQIGIDETTNQPVYDTVMTYFNPLFAELPFNDNDSLQSLVLVDNDSWNRMVEKYWPYMKQHVDDPAEMDPAQDHFKVDTAATYYAVRRELVKDLTCRLEGATLRPSVLKATRQVYTSKYGVEITMDTAVVRQVIPVSNGEIQVVSGAYIHLYHNKVKDVYVEAEDYYYSNATYKATLVDPTFSGSRYVKTYGVDSLRMYDRYVLIGDTTYNADGTVAEVTGLRRAKTITGEDSIEHVAARQGYVYNTSQIAAHRGSAVYGYKAQLFSCDYKIQWRHVIPGAQGTNYCNPDTLDVDYPKYVENPNYPVGGVMRHIQKLYLSQPGDRPLEYNSDLATNDYVLYPTANNYFSGTYKFYRCMSDYDPEANLTASTDDEVGSGDLNSPTGKGAKVPKVFFKRLGVNAGVGIDDPTFETPLIWCRTYVNGTNYVNPADVSTEITAFTSGIAGVCTNLQDRINNNTQKPIMIPRDIFRCFYAGEATAFVTGNPFGYQNAVGSASNYLATSIFLDYIHFIPQVGEDE